MQFGRGISWSMWLLIFYILYGHLIQAIYATELPISFPLVPAVE